MTKLLPKFSERTDRLRKLLNIWNHGYGEMNNKNDFGTIKQMLTEEPYLAHYAEDEDNIITSIASTTGFGIILWQKQDDRNQKPIAFGLRYSNETKNKYSIGELDLLAVLRGLDNHRFYLCGKKTTYTRTTKH